MKAVAVDGADGIPDTHGLGVSHRALYRQARDIDH